MGLRSENYLDIDAFRRIFCELSERPVSNKCIQNAGNRDLKQAPGSRWVRNPGDRCLFQGGGSGKESGVIVVVVNTASRRGWERPSGCRGADGWLWCSISKVGNAAQKARYKLALHGCVDSLWDGARIKSSRQNDELAGHMQVAQFGCLAEQGVTGGGRGHAGVDRRVLQAPIAGRWLDGFVTEGSRCSGPFVSADGNQGG